MNRQDAIVLLGLFLSAGCQSVAPTRDAAARGRSVAAAKGTASQPAQPVPPIPVSQGALASARPADPASLPPAPPASPAFEPVPTAQGLAASQASFPYPAAKDSAATQATLVSFDPAPAPPIPAAPQAIAEPTVSDVRRLYRAAADRNAAMDSYIARLRRREVVNGRQKPEEIALFKFRKEPWSVYFKWIGTEGKGREALYVKGKHEDKLHTLLAAGDMPLMPAGKVFSFDPESPLVRNNSRHPITEAGIGSLVRRFGKLVDADEARRTGTLRYLGPQQRAEYPGPLEAVEQLVPPRAEPCLPAGGRRWWFFDPANGLPVIVITHDEAGREVEYYCYDRIQYPVKLDDDDFNPNKLWTKR